jgi:hypothetical protein
MSQRGSSGPKAPLTHRWVQVSERRYRCISCSLVRQTKGTHGASKYYMPGAEPVTKCPVCPNQPGLKRVCKTCGKNNHPTARSQLDCLETWAAQVVEYVTARRASLQARLEKGDSSPCLEASSAPGVTADWSTR